MSYTFTQSPFLAPILGDSEFLSLFSSEADLAAMLKFEVALAQAQAKLGFISSDAAGEILKKMPSFKPNYHQLSLGIARDGVVVPSLVAQLRAFINAQVHYGATSQDVIDTSLMLRAKDALAILSTRLKNLTVNLQELSGKFGKNDLMARTRMQQALPFTVANRIAAWICGVEDAGVSIQSCHFPLQFGGPIGILETFGDKAPELKEKIVQLLELDIRYDNWQTIRSPILMLGNAACQLTGMLGKIGADYCLMSQNELAEVKMLGGGTSSAMHHKQNPVLAENLVTLARFNATLISGLHHSMVHEQERSGAAWTLEWMILPQLIVAAGAATNICHDMLRSTVAMG